MRCLPSSDAQQHGDASRDEAIKQQAYDELKETTNVSSRQRHRGLSAATGAAHPRRKRVRCAVVRSSHQRGARPYQRQDQDQPRRAIDAMIKYLQEYRELALRGMTSSK